MYWSFYQLVKMLAFLIYKVKKDDIVEFDNKLWHVTGFYCTFLTINCRYRANNFWEIGVFLQSETKQTDFPSITAVKKKQWQNQNSKKMLPSG